MKESYTMNPEELQRLRRLCVLAFAEVRHLKKLLISHGVIPQDDIYDYANSLDDYMKEMDSKDKLLIKDYPEM
jgi:hypothetical protein